MQDWEPRVHKFRRRDDQAVHIVMAFSPRRPRRHHGLRFVCGPRVGDAIRMAPHSAPGREPGVDCERCSDSMTAIEDILEGVR